MPQPADVTRIITGGKQGPAGPAGATGAQGPQGPAGAAGATGQGVPVGGTVGQVLTKDTATDFDTSWQDPTGGSGSVITQAVDLTLTAAESLNTYENTGAAALVEFTLPAVADGLQFSFYVADADGIRVTATNGENINHGTSIGAADGWLESTAIGSWLTIKGVAGVWAVIEAEGTWTAGAPAPPFSPADISNIVHWYKATSLSALANGDPVSTWTDDVGASDFTGAGSARPTYRTNAGDPYVEFDGVDDQMSATIADLTDFCIVMVADYPDNSAGWSLLTVGGGVGIRRAGPDLYDLMSNFASVKSLTSFSGPASKVLLYERVGADGRFRDNGAQSTAVIDTTATGTALHFVFGSGIGQYLDVNIKELIICNGGLSGPDETALATYISDNYGLTL